MSFRNWTNRLEFPGAICNTNLAKESLFFIYCMSKKKQQPPGGEMSSENQPETTNNQNLSETAPPSVPSASSDSGEKKQQTNAAPQKSENKELLNKIVQRSKTVGKKVKSTMKEKVKKVAEHKIIAENIKKIASEDGNQRQKLKGIFMMLVGLLVLLFIAVLLVNKFFRAQSLAELVPADTTIGFFEMDTDMESGQIKQLAELLKQYPAYQPPALITAFNQFFTVDYQRDVAPWLGRKAGVALVQFPSQPNDMTPIFFIETKDRQKALDFFQSRILKNSSDDLLVEPYNGYDFYTYRLSQPYSFFFLDHYVVLATNRQILRELSDVQKSSKPLLAGEDNFRKIANNLPQGGLGFGYVNIARFFDALVKNPAYTTQKARELLLFQPFLRLFAAKGISVSVQERGLQFQIFSSLDQNELQGATYLAYSDKYQGRLLSLADQGTLFLFGGHDLLKELNRLDEIFTAGTKTSSMLFQGVLEAQKQKYLGKDISLTEDIYPLLKGEYLATVSGDFSRPEITVLMQLTDKNSDLLRLEKIANAFIKVSAVFQPKIQEVTLPDGTRGQEVVASPEQVTRTDEAYEGVNVTTLHIGTSGMAVYYAVVDNTLLLNTSSDGIHRLIDRALGKKNDGLKNSPEFQSMIAPIFGSADEVLQLKIQPLVDMLGLRKSEIGKVLGLYLAPFQSVSSTKNFFHDGISELYLLGM